VLARVVYETSNVMVVEGVKRKAAGSPDTHQAGRAEQSELMGDGRFRQSNDGRQIADAPLTVRQGVNEANARGIAKQLEHVGDGRESTSANKARSNIRERCGVRGVGFGTSNINGDGRSCDAHNI
jgi:hypothetical protein